MTERKRNRGILALLKFLFVSHFCAPVYPGPHFEFHWKHDPRIDQWTWRRWNGKGATGAIVGCVGLGVTVLSSRVLWGPTEVDLIFGGASLLFLLIVIIRFGSFTTLTVDSTGKLRRVGSLLWMRPIVGKATPEQRYVIRGTISFCAQRKRGYGLLLWRYSEYWNRPAVWIEGLTDPISGTPVVLAAGTQVEMDAYVAGLPPPLQERISDRWGSESVCYMPVF